MFFNETFTIVATFNICKKEFNSTNKGNSQIVGNKANERISRQRRFILLPYCRRNIPEQVW